MQAIVQRSAGILQVPIDRGGVVLIASRSRGTPRVANRLLRRVRDYAQVRGDGCVDAQVAEDALAMMEVDHLGLDVSDKWVLQTLIDKFDGGPVGLDTIAASLSEDPISWTCTSRTCFSWAPGAHAEGQGCHPGARTSISGASSSATNPPRRGSSDVARRRPMRASPAGHDDFPACSDAGRLAGRPYSRRSRMAVSGCCASSRSRRPRPRTSRHPPIITGSRSSPTSAAVLARRGPCGAGGKRAGMSRILVQPQRPAVQRARAPTPHLERPGRQRKPCPERPGTTWWRSCSR